MKSIKNLVEYYDELFPVSSLKKSFYSEFAKTYKTPVHFLSVDCGTGFLESSLAREGHDVTGIENVEELLQSANLRRRSQLMSIRFFQMEKISFDESSDTATTSVLWSTFSVPMTISSSALKALNISEERVPSRP